MGSWRYMKWRIWIGAGVADMDTCNRYGWRQGNKFFEKGVGLETGGTIPFTNYVSAFQVSHFTVVSFFFNKKEQLLLGISLSLSSAKTSCYKTFFCV